MNTKNSTVFQYSAITDKSEHATIKDPYAASPKEIVQYLDRFVVSQTQAKKKIAIAIRNRWRRNNVPKPLQDEIIPKNILMIGPTGVGKTEIARRVANLCGAPFIKVEATKFTEIGYVGRDVDSIIRDLVDNAIVQIKDKKRAELYDKAKESAQERILDALVGSKKRVNKDKDNNNNSNNNSNNNGSQHHKDSSAKEGHEDEDKEGKKEDFTKSPGHTREIFKEKLEQGKLDEATIEIYIKENKSPSTMPTLDIPGMPGGQIGVMNIGDIIGKVFGNGKKTKKCRVKVKEAWDLLIGEEIEGLFDEDSIIKEALNAVTNNGIIFIDEIDKICSRTEVRNEVNREGVQRDLLPLLEGTTVTTKYGVVKTDHILFIASGAFHFAKPSDLLPEFQGRLPIRVELDSLDVGDIIQILKDTESSLLKQYCALMETERITLQFSEDGIKAIAAAAITVNSEVENIGARRLHTIMETLLEDISFDADTLQGQIIFIDEIYVNKYLDNIIKKLDLSKFIL